MVLVVVVVVVVKIVAVAAAAAAPVVVVVVVAVVVAIGSGHSGSSGSRCGSRTRTENVSCSGSSSSTSRSLIPHEPTMFYLFAEDLREVLRLLKAHPASAESSVSSKGVSECSGLGYRETCSEFFRFRFFWCRGHR